MDLIHYESQYSRDDELMHYGVRGMHWGIRRYQPYPDGKEGKFIGKKQAKKLVRSINKNERTRAQRAYYMRKSSDAAERYRIKANKASAAGKTSKAIRMTNKANKQAGDASIHEKAIKEIDAMRDKTIGELKKNGYEF